MADRPILFSAPMVRALLDGTKTQTRRVCKNQPYGNGFAFSGGDYLCHNDYLPPSAMLMDVRGKYSYTTSDLEGWESECPYGQPGDRLWVRESWMPDPPIDDTWASTQWAGCRDGKIAGVPERFRHPDFCNYAASWLHGPVRWTPSIHMPRWASRITLEITGVRVERLQDISEADARAEGCSASGWTPSYSNPDNAGTDAGKSAAEDYAELWESINGAGSWDLNPWVWVVEFKPAPPGQDQGAGTP